MRAARSKINDTSDAADGRRHTALPNTTPGKICGKKYSRGKQSWKKLEEWWKNRGRTRLCLTLKQYITLLKTQLTVTED